MNQKKGFFAKVEKFVAGKGFYMVLLLCLVLLGASGFYLYRSVAEIAGEEQAALTGGSAEIALTPEETEPVLEESEAEPVMQEEEAEQVTEEPAAAEVLEPVTEPVGQESEAEPVVGEAEPVIEESEAEPVDETSEAVETGAPVQETGTASGDEGMSWPVNGDVVAAFSASELVYNPVMGDWRTHDGVDINAGLGAEVLAAADGVVISVEKDPVLGTTVTLDHGDGLTTVYGNLDPDTLGVAEGDAVTAGSVLACVGSSAAEENETAFLHFGVRLDGVNVDPMDYRK